MLGPRPGALLPVRGLGRELAVLALCVLGAGCSDRLTPARAATIIRHSKAFLSGSVESHPVFDRVIELLVDPAEKEDTCIAEFSYHWLAESKAGAAGATRPPLTARVLLRRSGAGWAIDDERSRTLVPTWPQLPSMSSPFFPGAVAPSPGAQPR